MATNLRDYAKQQGLSVAYNPYSKNVMVGDKDYTSSQLQSMGGQLNNGSWQFADANALSKFGAQDKPQVTQPVVTPQAPVAQAPQGKTIEQLMAEITQQQQAKKVADFNQAFEAQRARLEAEKKALEPVYAEQGRKLSVADTMARKAIENQLAMQGLSGSGAMGQREAEQNMISQGAMGNLGLQRASAEASIGQRLSEAQRDRDYGIASANSDIESQALQNLLARLQQQEGYARQDALTADERAYNKSQSDITTAKNDENIARQRELDTIGQYSGDYQAEINRRQGTADTADDWLIPYLKQARVGKLSDIEQAKAQQEAELYKRAVAEQKYLDEQKALAEKERLAIEALKIKQQVANKPKATSSSTKTTTSANSKVEEW